MKYGLKFGTPSEAYTIVFANLINLNVTNLIMDMAIKIFQVYLFRKRRTDTLAPVNFSCRIKTFNISVITKKCG